jgi:hypothetical protein
MSLLSRERWFPGRTAPRFSLAFDALPVATLAVVLGMYLRIYDRLPNEGLVHGDGFYSWIFAHSLAFDGDVDLANDYALCGDPWGKGVDEGTGHLANPFYFGPALVWAPLLRLARALSHEAVPTFGCHGVRLALAAGPVLAVATLAVGYLLARRYVRPWASATAIAAIGLGSALVQYGAWVPCYSHVYAGFALSLVLLTWHRLFERPTRALRWALHGLALGFAFVMRPQLVVFAALTGAIVVNRIADFLATKDRLAPRVGRLALDLALLVVSFLVLASVQFAVNLYLYGHIQVIPQGKAYVNPAHAHPFLLLFSARNGLLYWHPIVWLAVFGLPLIGGRRPTLLPWIVLAPCAIEVYVSASALDWHGNSSHGARRLVSLTPVFVWSAAAAVGRMATWLRARPTLASHAPLALVVTLAAVITLGLAEHGVPSEVALPAEQLYPEGLRRSLASSDWLGNPFVAPASLVYAARYGVPPKRFEELDGGDFVRSYRPIATQARDVIDFTRASSARYRTDGMAPSASGLFVDDGTRLLLELSWPWVTNIRLAVTTRGATPLHARMHVRSFWGERGSVAFEIPAGSATVDVATPQGLFDSGVNEVVFDANGSFDITTWTWRDLGYHDTSVF